MRDSKYEPVIGEEDEDADSDGEGQQAAAQDAPAGAVAEEEKKADEEPAASSVDGALQGLVATMAGLSVREEGDF